MHFSERYSRLSITGALPLSAGKTTIGFSDCSILKALSLSLENLSVEGLKP